MVDIFRVHEGTSNGSPIASTSLVTLESEDPVGAGPTLAQLLQETVREGARHAPRSARASSKSRARAGSNRDDDHVPLPILPSLSSSTSRAYINSLLGKDLPALLKEPEELSRQSEVLDADLATLCYKSIGDLLVVGDCVDSVQDGFGRMQDALDSLLNSTELLSSSCIDFTSSITPVLSSRARLNLVRHNVSSIEDILSIPRLVSTCIRGGWWSEALDLAFRARELEDILKGPSILESSNKSRRSLLGKVREDVEAELETLRSRIIEGLRGRGLKLPSAVRSIALLRRMAAGSVAKDKIQKSSPRSLSDPELRLTFLASRWDCLHSQLAQLEMSAGSSANSDDRLRYVKRWIEVWREVVGETVTIYTEIFLSPSGSPSPSTTPLSPSSTLPKHTFDRDTIKSSPLALTHKSLPLPLFLSRALKSLELILQHQLPHLTTVSSLVSLQTQLSYCSAAFSKFGFDFRHIPNQAISQRLHEVTLDRFTTAVENFKKDLSRAFTQSGSRGGKPRLIVNALLATESWDSIDSLEESSLSLSNTSKTSHPPSFIALFPLLAKLLNSYASAFNELRLMPVTSIYPLVSQALHLSLKTNTEDLLAFVRIALDSLQPAAYEEDQAELDDQKAILRKVSMIHCRCLVPWCIWALDEIVYPEVENTMPPSYDAVSAATASLFGILGISNVQIQDESQDPQEPLPDDVNATMPAIHGNASLAEQTVVDETAQDNKTADAGAGDVENLELTEENQKTKSVEP